MDYPLSVHALEMQEEERKEVLGLDHPVVRQNFGLYFKILRLLLSFKTTIQIV